MANGFRLGEGNLITDSLSPVWRLAREKGYEGKLPGHVVEIATQFACVDGSPDTMRTVGLVTLLLLCTLFHTSHSFVRPAVDSSALTMTYGEYRALSSPPSHPIDVVYYINLDNRSDRRALMENELANVGY